MSGHWRVKTLTDIYDAALAHFVLWLRLPIFVKLYGTYKFSIIASDEVMVFHARVLEPDHSYACCLCLYPIYVSRGIGVHVQAAKSV